MKKQTIKIVSAVLIVLMLCLSFAGCQDDKKETERTTFTVGFDQNFPPFGYVGDDGEFMGFDLDMAAEVAQRNGWEIKYQPIEWDAKDMELSSGTIDCIWNGFTMEGREDDYTFSEPYMNNSQIVVVKADAGINSFADLKGKKVSVQTDSAAQAALQSEERKELASSFGELVVVGEYNTAFMDLEAGAVDAIAMDVGVAKYLMQKSGADKFKILDEELLKERYAVGFLKGNDELRDTVQATLEEMAEDGTITQISEKYFGDDVGIIGK